MADVLEAHPEGLVLAVYDIIMGRLKGRLERKQAAAVPSESAPGAGGNSSVTPQPASEPAAPPVGDKPKGKKAEDPLAKMIRSQVEAAIAGMLKAMAPAGEAGKARRRALMKQAFGKSGWTEGTGLPEKTLKMGLATLQALSIAPADDASNFPSEGDLPATTGEASDDMPTDKPATLSGCVDPGGSETQRLWVEMEGFAQSWEDITKTCKGDEPGRRILTHD